MAMAYYLMQNPWMSTIRYANVPFYGGDENSTDESLYLDIPFLLVGQYPKKSGILNAGTNGIAFYVKGLDKIYIKIRSNTRHFSSCI